MLDRKKSFEDEEQNLALLDTKMKKLQKELVVCECMCENCSNLIKLEQSRMVVTRCQQNLETTRQDKVCQEFYLKREFEKFRDRENDLLDVKENFELVST
jgi:hypothetical protein